MTDVHRGNKPDNVVASGHGPRFRERFRVSASMALAMCIAAIAAVPAPASHNADDHSQNAHEVASVVLGDGLSDIAFWGDLAVVGQFLYDSGETNGFSVVDASDPAHPRPLSRFICTGGGWDVSVWEDLVFVSVDYFQRTAGPRCDAEPGTEFQGIKIVSIADPEHPRFVGAVPMGCYGSHANTVVPDLEHKRVIVYATSLKLPTDTPESGCDQIIEVPLDDPARAKSVGTLPGDPVMGCHDIAVHLPKRLLAGACQNELRLYDISDLTKPVLLSMSTNPSVQFQHSAAFSNDGNALVTGEENKAYVDQNGLPTANCPGGTHSTSGALWFYDISNRSVLAPLGYYQLERDFEAFSPGGAGCDVHNFNTIPNRGDRDLLSVAWYAGGMDVIDFTELAAPKEIAHYQYAADDPQTRPHYWSAYFYRGHIWATNSLASKRHSLDVFAVSEPDLQNAYRLPRLNPQTQEFTAKDF